MSEWKPTTEQHFGWLLLSRGWKKTDTGWHHPIHGPSTLEWAYDFETDRTPAGDAEFVDGATIEQLGRDR